MAVVGILEDGIPWKCRTAARTLSGTRTAVNSVSFVRILADGRTTDIPLGRFCGNLPVTVLTCSDAAP